VNRAQTEDEPKDLWTYARNSRAALEYTELTQEIERLWPSD